jgi:hypothetical protein
MLPDTQQRQGIVALVCGPPPAGRPGIPEHLRCATTNDDSVLSESPPWRRPK